MINKNKTTTAHEADAGVGSMPLLEAAVRGQPLFKGMTWHQCDVLIASAMPAHFEPGERVFKTGDPANRFYLIQTGSVMLESVERDQAPVEIQTIGPGETLGWSWLFPPYCWHFDARALEVTEAIFFYGTGLREKCESDHRLGYELMKRMAEVMMQRMQATMRQLVELRAEGRSADARPRQ